jgi:hypothetical protein
LRCTGPLGRRHGDIDEGTAAPSPPEGCSSRCRPSECAQFRDRLTRARAEGELKLVAKLEDDPDWRATAFLLERGYRERRGKAEPQQTSVTITLTDEQLAVLTEGLRYVRARDVTSPIETQASNGSELPTKR